MPCHMTGHMPTSLQDPIRHQDQENKYGLFRVVGYTDSNYAKNVNNQKFITGYYFFVKKAITT